MMPEHEILNDPPDREQLLHELRLQQLELERQNEALRKSRESYYSFISQSHEAIYCTEFDRPIDISLPVEQQIDAIYQNAYLGECNQAMAVMYGFPSTEAFIGQRLVDFHGGADNPINRANYRKFIEANYRIIDSETEEVTSNGEKRFFLSNGIGIVENGSLLRIWGSAIDITARKQAEEALRESEAKYRLIVENTTDLIVKTDLEGRILFASPSYCKLLGQSEAQLLGKTYIPLVHEDDLPDVEKAVATLFQPPYQCSFAERAKTIYGWRWIEWDSWAMFGAAGEIVALVGIGRDITARKQAEEALRASEERFRSAFHTSPDSININRLSDGLYLEVNDGFLRILGYEREEVIGRTSLELNIWADPRARARLVAALKTNGFVENLEAEFRRKDGASRFGLMSARILRLGDEMCILSITRDITARKQAQEELRSAHMKLEALWRIASLAEADFKTICDHVLETLVRMTGSEYGFYGFINADESVMTIHAWSGEAMKGCGIVDKPQYFPIDQAGVWAEAVRQRAPLLLNDYAADHPAKKGYPDAHVPLTKLLVVPFFVHRRIITVAAVANRQADYDQDDVAQITAFLTSIQALIGRMDAEESLRESEEKFRATISQSADGILITDENFFIIEWSAAQTAIFGYSRAEMVGRPLWEFQYLTLPDEQKSPALAALLKEQTLAGGNQSDSGWMNSAHDIEVQSKDGSRKAVQVAAFPIVTSRANLYGAITRDVTERKRAEMEREKLQKQLLQAQKMELVGRLAGGVAHDFNNMLGVILGHTELAMMNVSPAQPLYADLEEIRKAAERSANLTRQLLAFARKQTVTPQVLDLNEIVAGMLKMLRRLIGEDINLLWLPAAKLWPIKIDPTQIDQILANLCVNARDAITGVGRVVIETKNVVLEEGYVAAPVEFSPGDYVLLAVSDDGCGIDQETQAHLFEPFFTTKEVGQGTGLGLATVYGVVKQNNGFINVYSEPGWGTTFKIYLPRHVVQTVQAQRAGLVKRPRRGQETILLVEDEPMVLELGWKILTYLGYTVLSASTPDEAIRLAEAHAGRIDLLMTDVIMPEMNGRELARRLLVLYPALKRLFMSGYTADVIAHHGIVDDGVNFIQKPFSMQELAAAVRMALDQPQTAG